MRYLRYALLVLLAVIIVSISIANRDLVTVRLLPDALGGLIGFNPSLTLPLFLAILCGIMIGLILGFFWEWMREYKHRRRASTRERELRQLEQEVGQLKEEKHRGKDEVLAILDDTVPARIEHG